MAVVPCTEVSFASLVAAYPHEGWKDGKLGTEKVGLSVFSGYLFFWCCFPSLSLVLCKYLCNYALYL